jgi:L-rhamnose-H+ transport protein
MLTALGLVLLAGGMNGSFAAPMKRVHDWEWEHTWLVWAFLALVVMPVTVATITFPNLQAIYGTAGPEPLLRTALYGMLWGASAVLFGLGVTRVGLALGFGIILGTASSLGAIVPFLGLHRDRLLSTVGLMMLAGVTIVLARVAACARAGILREAAANSQRGVGSFRAGIVICTLSGIGTTFMNLGLNEAAPISGAAESLGTPATRSLNAVWPVLLGGGFVVNAAYCGFLVIRRRTGGLFRHSLPGNFSLALAMAALWSGSNFAYGVGARGLDSLGLVLGWPIFNCCNRTHGQCLGSTDRRVDRRTEGACRVGRGR